MKKVIYAIVLSLSLMIMFHGNVANAEVNYSEGDWFVYGIGSDTIAIYQTIEIVKQDGQNVNAKATTRLWDMKYAPLGSYIDITDKAGELILSDGAKTILTGKLDINDKSVKKLENEEFEVNGKKINCSVYEGTLNGRTYKNYYSEDPSIFGLVMIQAGKDTYFQLMGFGSKDDKKIGGLENYVNRQYSPDATMVDLNEDEKKKYAEICDKLFASDMNEIYKMIYDHKNKKLISFNDMMEEVSKANLICLGEEHDSVQGHIFQLDLIKYMHEKGEDFAIGFEMFYRNASIQQGIDFYLEGKITEEEFQTKYFNRCWSPEWYKHFQAIFQYAKKNKIKMLGINCPKELKQQFRKDPNSLTELQRSWFAKEIDYSDEQHKKITFWNFQGMKRQMLKQGLTEDMINGMLEKSLYKGMCVWDDTMAESCVNYLKANPKSKIIAIVGSMHFAYRLGIPNRAVKKGKKEGIEINYKILFPHSMPNKNGLRMNEFMRTDLSDYIYFLPRSASKMK